MAGQASVPGRHPAGEALLKGHGVEAGEDALEGVVGGDAMGQVQKALEPGEAFAAEQGDLLEVVGTSDDGTQGNDQEGIEGVQLAAIDSWVLQRAKVAKQGKGLKHANPP